MSRVPRALHETTRRRLGLVVVVTAALLVGERQPLETPQSHTHLILSSNCPRSWQMGRNLCAIHLDRSHRFAAGAQRRYLCPPLPVPTYHPPTYSLLVSLSPSRVPSLPAPDTLQHCTYITSITELRSRFLSPLTLHSPSLGHSLKVPSKVITAPRTILQYCPRRLG